MARGSGLPALLQDLGGDRPWSRSEPRGTAIIAVVPAVPSGLLVAVVREGAARAAAPVPTPAGRCAGLIVLTLFGLINFPGALLLLCAHHPGLPTAAAVINAFIAYIAYNAVYAAGAYPAGPCWTGCHNT